MRTYLGYIFSFLVFPGLIFSAAMGLIAGWVDRKITARVQWRVGPPWYQNFFDVAKLMFYKETLVPEGVSRAFFFGMPVLAMAGAALVSTIILTVNFIPARGFIGDLIVVIYLMVIPSIAIMLGGFASANPYASLGASREMKMILSYELPFILALLVPVMKAGYTFRLGDIILYQKSAGPIIASFSGTISFLVMLLAVQAKLGFIPFDIAEAETEIISGPCIEYSGKGLGIFKIAKAIMTFALPVFMVTLYLGGIGSEIKGLAISAAEYVGILALLIVIKNTNPRVRIDQALRFFWFTVTIGSVLALIAAYFGY